MAWDLDTARGWARLGLELFLVLSAIGLIYHDAVISPPPDPITIGAGLSLIAGVFGWRQDSKAKKDES